MKARFTLVFLAAILVLALVQYSTASTNWVFDEETLQIIAAGLDQKSLEHSYSLYTPESRWKLGSFTVAYWPFIHDDQQYYIFESDSLNIYGSEDANQTLTLVEYLVFDEEINCIVHWQQHTGDGIIYESLAKPRGNHVDIYTWNSTGWSGHKQFSLFGIKYGNTLWSLDWESINNPLSYRFLLYSLYTADIRTFDGIITPDEQAGFSHFYKTHFSGELVAIDEKLDNNGHVLKSKSQDYSLTYEASSLERALEFRNEIGPLQYRPQMSSWIPGIREEISEITVNLSVRDSVDLISLNNHRQYVAESKNTIMVTIKAQEAPSDYDRITTIPVAKDIIDGLQITVDIDWDAPEILAMAQEVTKDEGDLLNQVMLLAQWVSDTIKSDYSIPDLPASVVLQSKQGRCLHNVRLYVAMLRSLGIPARPVYGWMLTGYDTEPHAWAEVYLGRWIEIDPSNGKLASAGHLRYPEDSLRHLDSVHFLALITAEGTKDINYDIPFWMALFHEDTFSYFNRILGFGLNIPKDILMFRLDEQDEPILLTQTFGMTADPLFYLMFTSPEDTAFFGRETTMMAKPGLKHNVQAIDQGVMFGTTLVETYDHPGIAVNSSLYRTMDDMSRVVYSIDTDHELSLQLILIMETLESHDLRKLPPGIISVVDSLLAFQPEFDGLGSVSRMIHSIYQSN